MDLASDLNIVEKVGTWYSFGDVRIGQGRENAKVFLRDNPEVRGEIERKILGHYNLIKEQKEAKDGSQ